jgi:hypothetical protein
MGRAVLVLASLADKAQAIRWIEKAPVNTRVTFDGPKRSTDQNALLWAALTDIATQKTYHGMRLSANDYKLLFLDALRQEMRIAPNLDGTGFVSLGTSSSALSKDDFSALIEIIYAWGTKEGVAFHEPAETGGSGSTSVAARMAPGGSQLEAAKDGAEGQTNSAPVATNSLVENV